VLSLCFRGIQNLSIKSLKVNCVFGLPKKLEIEARFDYFSNNKEAVVFIEKLNKHKAMVYRDWSVDQLEHVCAVVV
jgi:hypothetical protein